MILGNETSWFVVAAMALASMQGCDTAPHEPGQGPDELEDVDLAFRGDCNPDIDPTCSLANTFYLGLDEYRLDNIPLVPGSDPDTQINEILATQCYGSEGLDIITGEFHAVSPSLSVDADGNFDATVFSGLSIAGAMTTCTVSGELWKDTEWSLTTDAENAQGLVDTIDARLKIVDLQITPGQSTLYVWETDVAAISGGGTPAWKKVCDADPDPLLDFESVVYPYLRVDPDTGIFSTDADTAYLGCTSGMTAKSGYHWDFYPGPNSLHQVIANAGMAKYCGPSEDSFTNTGVQIKIWNKTDSGPYRQDPQSVPPAETDVWVPEAAWDASMRATCIGDTRLGQFHPGANEFFTECTDFDIPRCTPQLLDDPSVMFITYVEEQQP